MNIETVYKYSNLVAWLVAVVLIVLWYGVVSWWVPLVIAIAPTVMLLMVVSFSLVWSFFLTRGSQ